MHFVKLIRDPYLDFTYYCTIVLNNNELLFYLIIEFMIFITTVSYIVLLQLLTGKSIQNYFLDSRCYPFWVHILKKLFPSFQILQSYQLLNERKILSSLVVWIVVEVNEFLTEVMFSLPLNICLSS